MPSEIKSLRYPQHETWLEIRRDRLLANLEALKNAAAPYASVLAVVKANAYGHGLVETARTLAPHVSYLGVSSLREALTLREHDLPAPVFLFGRLLPEEMPAALVDGITLSVSSLEEAVDISHTSESLSRKTKIHIKVDTGMGRLGIPVKRAHREIVKIAALPALELEGIYTHFPTAESEDGFLEEQFRKFADLLAGLENENITFRLRHASNSAGSLKLKTPVLNLIRPGLMLYGIYPHPDLRNLARVSPVLSIKSRIILLKRLKAGESVGYGRDYVAAQATTIAYLPMGYSHGYPFRLSNCSYVLFQGKKFPLAGRVSMDYLAVDLGEERAKVGDEMVLLGESGEEVIRAEDLAALAGTTPYEIVTRLQPGIPRFYR